MNAGFIERHRFVTPFFWAPAILPDTPGQSVYCPRQIKSPPLESLRYGKITVMRGQYAAFILILCLFQHIHRIRDTSENPSLTVQHPPMAYAKSVDCALLKARRALISIVPGNAGGLMESTQIESRRGSIFSVEPLRGSNGCFVVDTPGRRANRANMEALTGFYDLRVLLSLRPTAYCLLPIASCLLPGFHPPETPFRADVK